MKKIYLFVLVTFLIVDFSHAQKILSFDMSALTIGNEDTLISNYNDANLSLSTLRHGPGVSALDETWLEHFFPSADYDPGLFNSYNWTTGSTVDLNDYIEFTITPNSGYQFSIRSITIQHEKEQNGPNNFVLRTSADGFTENLGGVFNIVRARELPLFQTIEFALVDVNTPLTIRLYGYNASDPFHTWGMGLGTHDPEKVPSPDNHIVVNGDVNLVGTPSIYTSKTSLSYFSYFTDFGPSPVKNFNLQGSNLTGDLTVNGGTNYEVSIDNSNFFSGLVVTSSGGNISSTPIYVRLKSGLASSNYIQNITISGGGATQRNINCDGFVSAYNLVINEIFSEGDQGDSNENGTTQQSNDEFIELVNIGSTPIPLNGFRIYCGNRTAHIFNSFTLNPGQAIVVFGGGNISNFTSSPAQISSQTGLFIQDAGDTITVNFDNTFNSRVAVVSFESEAAENQSLARFPDYTGPFVKHISIPTNSVIFSPGRKNSDHEPLPVELSSFSAMNSESGVRLEWRTETESNNYGFEVERSETQNAGGEAWEKIGFVEGNGNSNSPKDYAFDDNNVTTSKYAYRLKQIDNDGKYNYSKTVEVDLSIPIKFELSQNYPNPFNPVTTIEFSLPQTGFVKLTVFNLLGEEVATLIKENRDAGIHATNFNASKFNSGLYIYKLESNSNVQTKKMLLLK